MTRAETLVVARAARTRSRLERHAAELRGHGFIVIEPEKAAAARRLLLGTKRGTSTP